MTESAKTSSLEVNLRLGNGLKKGEREWVVRRLAGLDARLRSFRPDAVGLLVTIKDRTTRSQHLTLEASIANQRRLVATSVRPRLDDALAEVCRELARQLADVKTRREPAHQHHHQAGATH